MRYTCDGYRAVEADDAKDAAMIFANRAARAEYGKRGYARHARLDSWAESGIYQNFEAFIGTSNGEPGGMVGRNIWLTVYRG